MVTVAVVSWNTRDLLVRCLKSLAPEVEAGLAEVWVVDNASDDGSPDAVRAQAPWAKLLEPGENLGFGRAVNLVASQTDGEWLAAANADVALEPGALEALLHAGAGAGVGAVAPRLLLPDGGTQHSVYHFPTLPFTLAFNLGIPQRSSRLADRFLLEGRWDPSSAREVDWAIGAFLLLRRSAFDAVGGFDDEQWMYAEDLDLCWRLQRGGWGVRYEPLAQVRHDASAATDRAFGDEKVERFMAATYASLERRRGRALTRAIAAVNVAGAGARLAVFAALAGRSERHCAARDANRMWLRAHRQGLRRAPAP